MASPQNGRIILLNGAPRSGKSSIIEAIQHSFEGIWINLGVDHYMKTIPPSLQPGIGLRPGGERPDLEAPIRRMYQALFESIAAHSRLGLNIAADLGLHALYARPFDPMQLCAQALWGLDVLLVGVHCPIECIMARRKATWNQDYAPDGSVPPPILRWQHAVHQGRLYDLDVDTSRLTPQQCAQAIHQRLLAPHDALFHQPQNL
jgi:chloramphenicol 3-O phosphotransferase